MFHLAGNEAFWLNMTNLGLGLVTLAVLVVIAFSFGKEVVARFRKPFSLPLSEETHAFVVDGLGMTMADGGERTTPKEQEKPDPSASKHP
jgi:hypothetical protein